MRYFCIDCSHIFDEALWERELSIEPWTKFDDLDWFYCPNCEADESMFQPIEEEILYAEDSDNLSVLESQHIPHILHFDEKEVELSVGEDVHPSDEEHRILAIWLYDEDGELVEEHFFKTDEEPLYAFDVEDLDSFEIRAACNQHGVWSTGIIEKDSLEV